VSKTARPPGKPGDKGVSIVGDLARKGLDLSKLHKLAAGVALEIGCAEDTAKDFLYRLHDWPYAKAEMGRVVRKLGRAYGDFVILTREMKEELSREEAEQCVSKTS
jgi:hypothetical protein